MAQRIKRIEIDLTGVIARDRLRYYTDDMIVEALESQYSYLPFPLVITILGDIAVLEYPR